MRADLHTLHNTMCKCAWQMHFSAQNTRILCNNNTKHRYTSRAQVTVSVGCSRWPMSNQTSCPCQRLSHSPLLSPHSLDASTLELMLLEAQNVGKLASHPAGVTFGGRTLSAVGLAIAGVEELRPETEKHAHPLEHIIIQMIGSPPHSRPWMRSSWLP